MWAFYLDELRHVQGGMAVDWAFYLKIACHADVVGLALNLHWLLSEVLFSWFRLGRCK